MFQQVVAYIYCAKILKISMKSVQSTFSIVRLAPRQHPLKYLSIHFTRSFELLTMNSMLLKNQHGFQ